MYVDDLSLLKRRLSHDVVQFLKLVIRFQVFSPHIISWGLLVEDLFPYPLFMPVAPLL